MELHLHTSAREQAQSSVLQSLLLVLPTQHEHYVCHCTLVLHKPARYRCTAHSLHCIVTQSPHMLCGLWQVLSAYCKVYPTPPPSRRPIRMKQARLAAEKAAGRGGLAGGEDSAGDDQADAKPTRQKLGVFLTQAPRSPESFITRCAGICSGEVLVCCQVDSSKQPCNE